MKITELSCCSGVSLPTIKYYIRAGLLPPGNRVRANRTEYSDEHLKRLELIRALREIGGLCISSTRQVLEALHTSPERNRRYVTMAIGALSEGKTCRASRTPAEEAELERAHREVDQFLEELGWKTTAYEQPAQRDLVEALVTARRVLSTELPVTALLPYARAVEELANSEIVAGRSVGAAPADALKRAFLGTILFEPILIALHRIALRVQARRAYAEIWAGAEHGETDTDMG